MQLSSVTTLHLLCLYLILFLGLFANYTRFMLSTSILIFNLSESILFFGEPNDFDDNKKNPPSKPTMHAQLKGFTLFDFRRTYNYENTSRNASKFKYYGLGIAICTLCVGGYAAHQQKQQNLIAQEQNRIAQEKNNEFKRQNDLEEVSQKIISQEEYQRRHHKK